MGRFRNLAAVISGYEFWVIASLVGGSLLFTRLAQVAVVVAMLFWILRWLASRYFTASTPADVTILLLAATLPVTVYATSLPEITHPQVIRLLTGIALFYAIVNWCTTPKRVRWLLIGSTLAGVLLALIAPFSVEWITAKIPLLSPSLYQNFTTLIADTIHPNILAGSLVLLIPLPQALLFFGYREMTPTLRFYFSLALLAMLIVLLLTQSRGAWIAYISVLLLMVVLRWKRGWLVSLMILVAVLSIVYRFGSQHVFHTLSASSTGLTFEGRLEIWSRAIYMIRDFPLTGIGMGSYGKLVNVFYPLLINTPATALHAHNLYLQVAVDLGLPGLIAWLAVLLGISATCWRVYRHGKRNRVGWITALGAGLMSSQLAMLVHGLTDAVTWCNARPAPLVWALWGMAAACWNMYEHYHPTNTIT